MKLKFKYRMLIATFSLLATVGSAQAAQFIVNGNFSTPDVGGGFTNNQAIPGWTNLAETYVEIGNSALYGLPCISTGCHNLEVNNTTYGAVSQTVTGLTIGHGYVLSFDYGGREYGGNPSFGPQLLNVSFGGQLLAQDSGSYGTWSSNVFHVIATDTSQVLLFQSIMQVGSLPEGGNEITNVSLTAVPEPAAWAMMLVGLALVGVVLRRRVAKMRMAYG